MSDTAAREQVHTGAVLVVLADGRSLDQGLLANQWQSPEVQGALDSARARFGHALCMCRTRPRKLQIRMRDGYYHLAVWPQEGPLHDTECSFFRDEIGQQEVAANAQPDMGSVHQAAATALADRVEFNVALAANATGTNLISVKTFVIRLWERAALCRWHPSWTRDWGRARYELLRAARELVVNGAPAEELLFAPRPYRPSIQDSLNRDWDVFVRSLLSNPGCTRILIAPIRRISQGTAGKAPVIHLRHLRQPIGVNSACFEFLLRDCKAAVRACTARMQANDDSGAAGQPEVVGIFIVEGNSRGGVWARAGWLLPVHPRSFIPASNTNTMMLVDELIAQRHSFQHLPTEVAPMRRTGPDWLVRHVWGPAGTPVSRAAIEILDRGSSGDLLDVRASIAKRMQDLGVPTWTWVPHGPRDARVLPPLPPRDAVSRDHAVRHIAEIAAAALVDYRFGPSLKFAAGAVAA